MLTIKRIEFRNFRSYGRNHTTIDFTKPGTTAITARNDNGGTTNGFGKTSLLHCLTWLMYDQVIDEVNKDELINNVNKSDLWGELTFSVDADEYIIRRWRKGGKSRRENGVQLIIEGEDKTPASVDSTNEKIVEIVGIDFELFSRIVVYSASNRSFFELPHTSASGANQTSMIEQLFNLQILSEKADTLKQRIKETKEEVKLQTALIQQATEHVESHATLLQKTQHRIDTWSSGMTDRRAQITADLQLVDTVDYNSERDKHNELAELRAKRITVLEETKQADENRTRIIDNIDKLKSELADLQTSVCPYCKQQYNDAAHKTEHVTKELNRLLTTLSQIDEIIESLAAELNQIVLDSQALKRTLTIDNIDRLFELRSQYSELQAALAELDRQTNPHIETLAELKQHAPTPPSYDKINELTSLDEHQQLLLKLLTKKDSFVRKALLHQNIPLLNEQLAKYLTELGLPHVVMFNPNLTASIKHFGRELTYGQLSAGQKARVNFALSLAFGDMLQILHRRINIQLFDEVLDLGLCNHGIVAASKLLRRKAKDENLSIFIISHREEVQNAFDNTITVVMSDGFSVIEGV